MYDIYRAEGPLEESYYVVGERYHYAYKESTLLLVCPPRRAVVRLFESDEFVHDDYCDGECEGECSEGYWLNSEDREIKTWELDVPWTVMALHLRRRMYGDNYGCITSIPICIWGASEEPTYEMENLNLFDCVKEDLSREVITLIKNKIA